jgi:IS4 transposase
MPNTCVSIINKTKWSTQTLAAIFKSRCKAELFCKRSKQNLKIRSFQGHAINRVATQDLVALCVSLLIAYLNFVSRSLFIIQAVLRLPQLNLLARRPQATTRKERN